jgi:hypothetical protein
VFDGEEMILFLAEFKGEEVPLTPADDLPAEPELEFPLDECSSNCARIAAANFILSAFISPTLSSSWGGDSAKHFLGGFPLVFGLATSRLLVLPSPPFPPLVFSDASPRETFK